MNVNHNTISIYLLLVTKVSEDALLSNEHASNDDNITTDVETMSDNDIVFLEHQPNQQTGDAFLINNLESVNSGTSTNSNDITNFDDGNANYYIAETIPSNMDSDDVN